MNTARVIVKQYEHVGVVGGTLRWEISCLVDKHLVGGRAAGGEDVVGSGAGAYQWQGRWCRGWWR